MADVLQALGNSNFNQSLGLVLNDLRSRRNQELMDRRTDIMEKQEDRMGKISEERLRIMRREEADKEKQRQFLKTEVPVASFANSMPFGEQNPYYQTALKYAQNQGFVTEMGGISNENLKRTQVAMQDPNGPYASAISAQTVALTKNIYDKAISLRNPHTPPDVKKQTMQELGIKSEKELPAAIKQAEINYKTFFGQNAALQKAIKTENEQKEAEAKLLKAQQGDGGGATASMKEYELARSQGYQGSYMEYKKATKDSGGASATASMKEYDLAKNQGYQGSFIEYKKAMSAKDPRDRAIRLAQGDVRFIGANTEQKKAAIVDQYEKLLTGKRALGDLPEGVTEEDVEYTMKQHGMTRAEVLEAIRNQ